jgi:hypothetical protein
MCDVFLDKMQDICKLPVNISFKGHLGVPVSIHWNDVVLAPIKIYMCVLRV